MCKPLLFLSVVIGLAASIATQAGMRLDYRVNTQLLVSHQDLEDKSIVNAGNGLKLHEDLYELDIRPDFTLSNERLSLSIKPRAEITRDKKKQTPTAVSLKKLSGGWSDKEASNFLRSIASPIASITGAIASNQETSANRF